MRKKLLIGIALFALVALLTPYHTIARELSHKKFIEFILSKAAVANGEILQQRRQLLNLYHAFLEHKTISQVNQHWLKQLATQYRAPLNDFHKDATWLALMQRVDIVPNSLVVAQAINESAWGTSRFAKQGNNYFGQWCYTKNCGIVPKQRAKGAQFEVRKFPNALSSVKSYMLNLNSNHLYQQFRHQRHLLRLAGEPIYGLNLANALTMYSTRREAYVKMIQGIIKRYKLAVYDSVGNTSKPKEKSGFFDWF